MKTAHSDRDDILHTAKQQVLTRLETRIKEEICWTRVIKLPLSILLVMALTSVAVAGHTYYIETDSKRIIALADQAAATPLQADSTVASSDQGIPLVVKR